MLFLADDLQEVRIIFVSPYNPSYIIFWSMPTTMATYIRRYEQENQGNYA